MTDFWILLGQMGDTALEAGELCGIWKSRALGILKTEGSYMEASVQYRYQLNLGLWIHLNVGGTQAFWSFLDLCSSPVPGNFSYLYYCVDKTIMS